MAAVSGGETWNEWAINKLNALRNGSESSFMGKVGRGLLSALLPAGSIAGAAMGGKAFYDAMQTKDKE